MNEENVVSEEVTVDEEMTMDAYMHEIEDTMKRVKKGDVIDARVVSINDEEIVVNIGYIADGVIPRTELLVDTDARLEDAFKVEDVIKAYVLNPQDDEGNVILSQKKAEQIVVWDELSEAYENNTKIKVRVKDVVKGGVNAYYKSVRCFIPGSLLSYRYVDDMNTFIDQELIVKVEDFDEEKKKVILSRKSIEVEERDKMKEVLWEQLVIGEKRMGTVTKLMNFGAFVDIGGTEGLIHLNDLAWQRVKHPSEILTEGDEVEVYVISFDKKTKKIGLGLKNIHENPWHGINDYYSEGDIVQGTVVRVLEFGAFVEIEAGIEGLVHISEISSDRVNKPSDVLKVGQEVEVLIMKIDEKEQRISLSIKEAEGAIYDEVETNEEEQNTTLGDLFGDKLKDLFK